MVSLLLLIPITARQGAPSTIRCIETVERLVLDLLHVLRQGAPSTIRCIETASAIAFDAAATVREHPAPSGALRPYGALHKGR